MHWSDVRGCFQAMGWVAETDMNESETPHAHASSKKTVQCQLTNIWLFSLLACRTSTVTFFFLISCREILRGIWREFARFFGPQNQGLNMSRTFRSIFVRHFITQKEYFVPTSLQTCHPDDLAIHTYSDTGFVMCGGRARSGMLVCDWLLRTR